MFNRRTIALLLPLAFAPLGACAIVLGIEDRELAATAQLSCEGYCDVAMANCTDAFALYASRDSCLATCTKLDLGTQGDMTGNTVACRLRNAELAGQTGEKSDYCVNAGPGGNAVCGTDCEAFCKLMKATCTDEFTTDMECMTECATVPDKGNYNIAVPLENSIECRLYHLSSATIDITHCPHAAGIIKCVDSAIPDGGADGG